MTRETKIGLLVGLAFIIVIGILLSDYNRIETPNAPLYQVREDVNKGVVTPGSHTPTQTTIVYPPKPVTPHQPVPTQEDLQPHPNMQDEVVISGNSSAPIRSDDSSRGVVVGPGNGAADIRTTSTGTVPSSLQQQAKDKGLEIVPVTSGKETPSASKPSPAVAGKQYTAEPGDTVSKMAGRFMGGNTKANRDAIVAANPSLQKNINNVIVGHTYVIPGASTAAATPQVTSKTPQPVAVVPVAQAPVNQPQATPTHWYTVKENDSLWRIAQEQLGDGNAVAAIKELNKDVLKGGDGIRPNMRLRLPAKPLASAN